MRVLIVEDEARLNEALVQIMTEQRYMADAVFNGEDGLAYAQSGEYDVIVLDVMLPRLSGYEVARRLRLENVATPILMLTAKDELPDKIKGLDGGADDYMTKPFSPEELLARIRALTRRPDDIVYESVEFGDVSLDLSANTLRCGKKEIHLSFKEFEILRLLMLAKQALVSKETLIVKVWGSDSPAEDNNVEAYISFLRKKLLYVGSRVGIETVRKVGYRLKEDRL